MDNTETKIELEKSDYLKERQRLWQLYETPTISQARINLGEELARLIFEQCEKALEKEFGLTPPLQGPGDILWSSPSDLLLGKLALKPPITPKCLQALTHQCILDVGYGIEGKFRHELELEMQKALEKQRSELQRELEDQLKYEIKDVEIRERFNCQLKVEKLMQEFEQILIEELDKLESRLRTEYEYVVKTHEQKLKQKWQRDLDQEVQDTVEVMSVIFFKKLEEQEEVLSRNFKFELKKREIQKNVDIKLEQHKFKHALKHLRHNLECCNIANMMYVLCIERRKCCEEKTALEAHYKAEIQKMQKKIDEKSGKIKRVTREKERALNDVKLRETCLTEIIKQYQKFINFALKAAPTQAEFLLSIEKMMVFELSEAAAKSQFPRLCSTLNLLPLHEEPLFPSRASGIEINDFHDCYKILNPPLPDNASELGPDDYLPAVYFKNKLYMREDFRNMLSQGIEITPSNELWNKDVEILLDTMRSLTSIRSTEKLEESTEMAKSDQKLLKSSDKLVKSGSKLIKPTFADDIPVQESRGKVELENSLETESLDRKSDSKKISVPLVVFEERIPKKDSVSKSNKIVRSRKSSRDSTTLKPILDLPEIDYSKVGASERHKSILSTRDSLEIIRDRSSVKRLTLESEEFDYFMGGEDEEPNNLEAIKQHALIQTFKKSMDQQYPSFGTDQLTGRISDDLANTNDSIILRRTSLLRKSTEFTVSPKDSLEVAKDSHHSVKQKSSKLASARNSVEILRESLMKIREPIPECPKKHESAHSFTRFTRELCCDKCYKTKESTDKLCKLKPSQEVEVVDGIIKNGSSFRNVSDHDRCVKMSHIEVYNMDEETRNLSNVIFVTPPIVYEEKPEMELYEEKETIKKKSQKAAARKKTKKSSKEDKQELRIIGDLGGKEGCQAADEFTVDRIHSFVELIKDHPNLIRMFTGGQ